MGNTQHNIISNNIAKAKNAEYHSDKGVDIRTSTQAIEVEVDPNLFKHGMQQLRGSSKVKYLAVPKQYVKEAIEITHGSKIGVMSQSGIIIKRGRK